MDNELRKKINNLILSKKYDEAENICNNYLKNNSANGEIYYYLGLINGYKNIFIESKKYFDKAIKLGWINSEIYFNRALAHRFLNKYYEAIEDYNKSTFIF